MRNGKDKNKGQNIPQNHYEDDFTSPVKSNDSPQEEVKKTKITKNSPVIKILVAIAAVAAVAFAALGVYGATLPKSEIIHGIKVSDVLIGGLTEKEAKSVLEVAGVISYDEVIIKANGKKFAVKTADIDVQVDLAATAKKAFDIGKGSNVISNAVEALKVKLTGNSVAPVILYDDEKFAVQINNIGSQAIGSVLTEHSVRFDETGKAYIVPGQSGYNNDPTAVMAKIKEAILKAHSNELDVDFEKTSPKELTIEALDLMIYCDPQNASFALENGEVKVLPAVDGRYIDKDYCKKLLPKVYEGGEEIEVPYSVTKAEVNAEELQKKLFNATLGSYTTRYAASGNRGSNVANAASRINNKILLPGETFSFNETVGRRTVANGFKTAPEYMNGQTVDGIGGGTCQVSTTLYSAVLYADLKIVKRSNHSMSVSYVPLGQDATVTDGGIDFQFMNDTAYPVKISSTTGGGKITVTIIGTEPEPAKTVKLSHQRVSVQTGSAVNSKRLVYDANGTLIKEENLGMSRYKPHADTISADEEEAPKSTEAIANTQVPEEVVTPTEDTSRETAATQKPETEKPAPATEKPAPATEKPKPEKVPTADEGDKTPVKTE